MDIRFIKKSIDTFYNFKKNNFRNSLIIKVTVIMTFTIAMVAVISNTIIFNLSDKALKEEIRENLILVASSAVLAIDGEKLKLIKTPEDEDNKAYLELQEVLQNIKKSSKITQEGDEKLRYVYTVAKQADKYIYVIDAEPKEKEEHSCVGDEFPVQDYPESVNGFEIATADSKPLKDIEFGGMVISGYAPIRDNNGNVVGMLGIDMDVSVIEEKEEAFKRAGVIASIIALLLSVILGIVFSKHLTKPIITLTKSTKKVSEGDFDIFIKTKRKDEIGQLARAFNIMTNDLKVSRETLKKNNAELEDKVTQRTIELLHINKEIKDILDNISQGIFTINPQLEFNAQHSRHAFDIFGDIVFARRKFSEVFFPRGDQNSDRKKMSMWLSKVFSSSNTEWENIEALQPIKEIKIIIQKERKNITKYLTVKFKPISDVFTKENSNNNITKLMIIVQDITETKSLQLEIEKKEKEYEDNIKQIVEIIKMDTELFQIFIDECKDKLISFEPKLIELKNNKDNMNIINDLLRIMHTIKGNAKAFKLERIAGEAHSLENIFASISKRGESIDDEVLSEVFGKLDHFNEMFNDTLVLYDKIVHGKSIDIGKTRSEERNKVDKEIIKVNVCEINRLSELVKKVDTSIGRYAVTMISLGMEKENLEEISYIIKETEEQLQSIKKIEIGRLFARLPRLARDISMELGKKIKLITSGDNITLDKNIFDNISDPIIHIVRNALDHGIEFIDERKSKGKPEEGRIEVIASTNGRVLLVEISDDGKGLDINSIKKKAVKRGLINDEKAELLSDEEAAELIFLPNFSTNEKITIVSGRGMGMNVVKRSIEENLKGSIKLENKKNQGFKLILTIPVWEC